MAGNFRHNISQIFLNDLLNTIALRQLLYGNEAKAFKDNIDRIKRMAGPNSSGRNVSFAFTAPELGIRHSFTKFHHVTYRSTPFQKMNDTKPGDKDDAQMYCTAKGMRYALFGFGKLTKQQADIISKMERGEPVTQEEFFGAGGIKENKGATNSMKVVYFDNNNVYLKCSMIPLYRELTSIKAPNGDWIAKPYMQELHELLNKLEEFEAGVRRDERGYIIRDENGIAVNHGETVVYAGPETHSKGLKQNVASSRAEINNSHFIVERSYDGVQFKAISDAIYSKAKNGNSASPLDYAYTDPSPKNGHNYYRLQMIDLDKRQRHSDVHDVYFGSKTVVTLYPNPVQNELGVTIYSPYPTTVNIQIMDAAGRTIQSVETNLLAGENQQKISLSDVSEGIYLVKVTDSKGLQYSQLIRKE
jgi:hypothetical protein